MKEVPSEKIAKYTGILSQVKKSLDNGSISTLREMKAQTKTNDMICFLLSREGLVYKNTLDKYCWNAKIPVTPTLGRSFYVLYHEYASSNQKKNRLKRLSDSEQNSTISNKVVDPYVKKVKTNIPDQNRVVLSLLWGAIKITL